MTEKRTPVQGSIHKRAPQRPATVPTDIYISGKSKSNAIIKRVTRLMLKENHKSVTIHGLGAMVIRATSMALAAQEALENQVVLKPVTETIALTDDIIPDDMDKDLETQKRNSSIIHIKLEAKDGLAELQQRTGKIIHHPSRNRRSRRWL
ncbi:hypothetical protein BDF21DRAFT_419184 [Thamnidium elegans]|uniref:Uncharacterized protein n=1 Tax=Thamnidium elegans TaxID=101142 RepID=A0A8H7T0K8_9FUNG|nr:hypothetical protein INT48_009629 [Thamnidium elegans]KAI8080525.1 hypothetical protein BDF21DRAFT_419184 [Thamnidium elegans]